MNGSILKYISLGEAAKLTSYSQDYISLLCRQGKLKGEKMGRNWVTTKDWVYDYINRTKGKGSSIVPVKINKFSRKEKNAVGAVGEESMSMEHISFINCGQEKDRKAANAGVREENAAERKNNFEEYKYKPLKAFKSQKRHFLFVFELLAAAFAVSIFSVGFIVFSEDNFLKLDLQSKISKNLEKEMEWARGILGFSREAILSAVNENRKEGRVAGIENSLDEEADRASENGMVVVPLEDGSAEGKNQELIKRISSSFSDDVDIKPMEDGASGIISPKDSPDEKYLYLMVPVEK